MYIDLAAEYDGKVYMLPNQRIKLNDVWRQMDDNARFVAMVLPGRQIVLRTDTSKAFINITGVPRKYIDKTFTIVPSPRNQRILITLKVNPFPAVIK